MNAKISWVERVVPLLQDYEFYSGSEVVKLDFTKEVNKLLITYARKSLDFPVLVVEEQKRGKPGHQLIVCVDPSGERMIIYS